VLHKAGRQLQTNATMTVKRHSQIWEKTPRPIVSTLLSYCNCATAWPTVQSSWIIFGLQLKKATNRQRVK